MSPSPADCKKLSIYSQHPSPQGEGTSGNPTASGWGIKQIKHFELIFQNFNPILIATVQMNLGLPLYYLEGDAARSAERPAT